MGYELRFAEHGITFRLDHLRGLDELSGDLKVQVGARILVAGRISASSLSQRETWARRLNRRQKGDWDLLLDLVAAEVLERERHEDDLGILLEDAQGEAHAEHVLGDILLGTEPNMFVATDGHLKSLLGLAAIGSLHFNRPVLGITPRRRMRVGMLEFEMAPHISKERARQLFGDVNLDIPHLDCRGQTLFGQIERVLRWKRERGVEFVMLDSVAWAADGPLEESDTARRFYSALDQLKLGSLLMAHPNRAGDIDRPLGSRLWRDRARLVWHLQALPTTAPNVLTRRLTSKKASLSATPKPMAFEFAFTDDRIDIRLCEGTGTFGGSISKRMRETLNGDDSGLTCKELAQRIGTTAAIVRTKAHELTDFELVDMPGSREKLVRLASVPV